MTHHDSLDRDLSGWFADDAARQVPSGLLDAIASTSRTRRQQPAWFVALRGESMGSLPIDASRVLRIALVAMLVAAIAATVLLTAGMLPTLQQHRNPLAFIRDGDVYVAAEDGSEARLLHHQDGVEFATVAWSRDGASLALDAEPGVSILDVQTRRVTVVGGHDPVWSPDGRALAVLAGAPSQGDATLRILDGATLEVRAVLPFGAVGGLAWAPNGRWIAATGGGEAANAVLRIDVATGEVIQIGPSSGHLSSLKQVSWSPDSERVAFIRYFDPGVQPCRDSLECRVDVYVANADGSNPVRINGLLGQADTPNWSPNGTWVAFREITLDLGIGIGLRVVRPDGTGERSILVAPVAGYLWDPTGDRLLFARIDLMNPDPLWETTLTGQSQPLGVLIDDSLGSLARSGLAFDWQAAAK